MVIKRRSFKRVTKRKHKLNRRTKKKAFNMRAAMKAYYALEKKIDKTWKQLREDVKKRSRQAIIKGRRDLLLLLGECNYMARECSRNLLPR